MLENPLKDILVKKAAGGFGTPYVGGNQSDLQAANQRASQEAYRARSLSKISDAIAKIGTSKLDDWMLPYGRAYNVFDANGQINEDAVKRLLNSINSADYFNSSGGVMYGDPYASTLSEATKDFTDWRDSDVYDALKKGFLARQATIQKGLKDSTSIPTDAPAKNPLGKEITGDLDLNTEVSDEDAFANAVNSSLAELGQYGNEEDEGDIDFSVEDPDLIAEQVSIATPASTPAQAQIPAETATATPATTAKPAKTKTPAGLTREETMQFLEQGYVPTSNGGFMLHEQQAANMLKRMQQSPDYNPGQVITDPSRLGRIRNNMLGNYEHTAQGRQETADDMVYQKAMYHKNRQAEIDARNNAALEQYRGQLTEDTRTDYLRRGKLDYQRSVLNGTPLTPAAQYYQAYSNAEIDGKPAPALPTQVQQNIDQGMHKFRGQLAAPQKPVASAPVNPRNPNYITQREMAAYSSANNSGQQAVNTVGSWDPNRLKAAQERHNKAISGNVQPVQPNTATPASTPSSARTVNPLPAGQPSSPASASTGTSSKQTPAVASK